MTLCVWNDLTNLKDTLVEPLQAKRGGCTTLELVEGFISDLAHPVLQMCVCLSARHPLWRQRRATSSSPNSPHCSELFWQPPASFVRAGAGGSQVLKGHEIQAWQLPHVVICLCLILFNIAEAFILIFLSQALFYLTKAKMGFVNERHFSFGFWEIVFLFYFFLMGKKIKGNSVDIWKSSFVRTCLL